MSNTVLEFVPNELRDVLEAGLSVEHLGQSLQVLLSFWHADWHTRLHILKTHEQVLLNESIEPLFAPFQKMLEKTTGSPAIAQQRTERLRILLHHCRAWGIEPGWFFAAYMLLEDNIAIPAQYEERVQQIATLLSQQKEDSVVQAIIIMQTLLDRLTAETPILFEAALLCDLATEMASLPHNHPARLPKQIVAYYREALPHYQAAERLHTVAFIQRLLATILREQGHYRKASESLQAALAILLADEQHKHDAAWTLSDYADTLYCLGHREESLESYKMALALLPGTSALLYRHAEKLILARRLNEAKADLEQALILDGNEDNPQLWLRRAQLAIAQKDGAQAERMLQEAHARDPHLEITLLDAQSAWMQGDVIIACEHLQQIWQQANAGDKMVIRREMMRLLNEQPNLPGSNKLAAILVIQR